MEAFGALLPRDAPACQGWDRLRLSDVRVERVQEQLRSVFLSP